MYTLGIPDRLKKRTLGYLKQIGIEFVETPGMEGFFDLGFPGMDEGAFRNIIMKLKQQGVTVIGADEELTETKIMKLTDLIKEDFSKNLNESDSDELVTALKNILLTWQSKQYADDRSRWEEYYMDIQDLINDFESNISNNSADESDPYSHDQIQSPGVKTQVNIAEQKVRKLIRKTLRQ